MLLSLMPISKKDFLSLNYIYFSDINEGFSSYCFKNLKIKENLPKENATSYFSEFLINEFENTTSSVFVDFYIKNLTDEQIKNLASLLSDEYKEILNSLLPLRESDTVFFEIKDKKIIPFLTELSTKELFFTTFYFKHFTLWGNFNQTFPMFCRCDKDLFSLSLPQSLYYQKSWLIILITF